MDRPRNRRPQLLLLSDFARMVPASESKLYRLVKKEIIEFTQPAGPNTDIYIPDDAFEKLVIRPPCLSDDPWRETPRRFLDLLDFVKSVPASASKVRRLVRGGLVEHTQPEGPRSAIYLPENAFERLACNTTSAKTRPEGSQQHQRTRRSGPRPRWQSE